LCGMTGTAKTEEAELRQVYGMNVIQIPTNRPVIRQDMPDRIYRTINQKYKAVTIEVKEKHTKGQPVLIGTTSILQSEKVAKYLAEENLPYELLNAKTVEQENEFIAKAGQYGRITIATNMAGRGTDILLGEGVPELGGLHVIGTERHESRRVDNQLKGRSGRQGDPGSSQFIISMEDDMFRRFAKEELEKLLPSLKTDDTGLIQNTKAKEFVDRVQRIVEGSNFSMREYNLKLDDVINEQRRVVYHLRNSILEQSDRISIVIPRIENAMSNLIHQYCQEGTIPEKWDLEGLKVELGRILIDEDIQFPNEHFDLEEIQNIVSDLLSRHITKVLSYSDKEELQFALKEYLTFSIDQNWIKHLEKMSRLKEGIGMRHYQQEDPMRLYQHDGLELFEQMYAQISKEMSIYLTELIKNI
jgi:preprotein translocase subunit SecA